MVRDWLLDTSLVEKMVTPRMDEVWHSKAPEMMTLPGYNFKKLTTI